MSDLYNELIDELEKCDIFVRYSTIEPKTILDLSEHDKPFKVKIRELKESYQKNAREIRALEKEVVNYKQAFEDKCADYGVASELLGEYQRENEVLKKRIQELDAIDAMRIDEKRELKQRIAELEDKIGDRDEINRCLREQIEELQKEIEHLTEEYKVISDFANKQMQKNERLKCDIDKMATSKSEWIDKVVEWQQKCEKLESKETETCKKEPISDDARPSIEWYGNRHQSDCIEINRLNTTIDVLIHKVEYLRQFAGLE